MPLIHYAVSVARQAGHYMMTKAAIRADCCTTRQLFPGLRMLPLPSAAGRAGGG